MALLKHIFKLSDLCSALGMRDVVICPGSRSAAITLAFNRNPQVDTQVLADERSAGFLALGKASISQIPVGLVCTSGSAAYNFAPAVSEAFFQEIPMILFTADRPPEWIHQYDGQTIYQDGIYGKHVKKSYTLPTDYTHPDALWAMERMVNEAYGLAMSEPKGPVHINIPIREPFYPEKDEKYKFSSIDIRKVQYPEVQKSLDSKTWEEIKVLWKAAKKPMIAVGQQIDLALSDSLNLLIDKAVVVVEAISNVYIDKAAKLQELYCEQLEMHTPDLLITCGKSFLSKAFKKYIRNSGIKVHFHVQDHPDVIDPLQTLSHKLMVSPDYFFEKLAAISLDKDKNTDFISAWQENSVEAMEQVNNTMQEKVWGQFLAIKEALVLAQYEILHIGNSMPVRYLNYLQAYIHPQTLVMANRGTSGIDGIVSTAIGQALESKKNTLCVVGDVSFFYDSNALFISPFPQNLRIVVINNAGGNIFRQIDGPANTPELETHFVGSQTRTAESLCKEAGLSYAAAKDLKSLQKSLQTAEIRLIEVFVNPETDVAELKKLIQIYR